MWHDVRDALRAFRKTPMFTALAVIVLALGIGTNTAIFSLVHAVLFKPPAVRAPSELRYIYGQPDTFVLGYRQYQQILASQDVIPDLVAVTSSQARLGSALDGRHIAGEAVSANYFDVLGVTPILGRRFIPAEDEAPNPEPVTIISHRLWMRQFSGDPAVIGRMIDLTRPYVRPEDQWPRYTIVGVAPEGFTGVSSPWAAADYWVPLVQRAADQMFDRGIGNNTRRPGTRNDAWFTLLVGRLPAGESDARAVAAFAAIGEQLRQELFPQIAQWTLVPFDGRRVRLPFDPRGQIVPERLAAGLFLVAGVVLIIAVTNLAGMLMARAVTRQQEIAVRLSLGASRWQIGRRLLVESLLIAIAGGVAGIGFARVAVVGLVSQTPTTGGQFQAIPFTLDVTIDGAVLAFTLLVCLGAAVIIAMAPARQAARVDLLSVLGAGVSASPRRARWRMRHLIVIPQVGLSAALLLVAGVLARPLLQAELVDPGYTQDKLAFAELAFPPPPRDYKDATARAAWRESRLRYQTRVLELLERAPEVSAGAMAFGLPFSMSSTAAVIAREAFPDGRHWWVKQNHVSPRYFEALGMKFLDGRGFEARDRAETPRVAVISATLAQWMWPGRSGVGEYLALHRPDDTRPPKWVEVIGVVNDVQPPITTGSSNPFIYVPVDDVYAMTIVARSRGDVGDLARVIRQLSAEANADVAISRSGPVGEAIAAMEYPRRMAAGILSASGFVGLVLAAAGLYGVISYSVAQRLRELGIRATLGAGQRALMLLVLREGATVAGIGVVLGLTIALLAVRVTSSYVVAIPSIDTATLVVVPLILAAVVFGACFVPARRASRVDPIVVLRAG